MYISPEQPRYHLKAAVLMLPILVLTILLTACSPAENSDMTQTGEDSFENGVEAAQEGEFCGGIAGIACADGLTCNYDGNYPDAGGVCVRGG